jgi:hypothetical protein
MMVTSLSLALVLPDGLFSGLLITFYYFIGIRELTSFGSAILSDSPMWFTTALSTDFGQTGFAPIEELLIISRIYIIYPIPNHTALDGVSRWRYGQ